MSVQWTMGSSYVLCQCLLCQGHLCPSFRLPLAGKIYKVVPSLNTSMGPNQWIVRTCAYNKVIGVTQCRLSK